MKKYICGSDNGSRSVSLFCGIIGSLSAKNDSTVMSAIDTACACGKLCEMPRATLRDFHNATTKERPSSASGSNGVKPEKKKHVIERATAAVQQYIALYGINGNIDKAGLNRLLKDLPRACDKPNSDEHRLIPNSLLDASIDVAFDLNNAKVI
ncbi:hypothetical protein PG985_009443 [Apiospora marii]|uniref:uncharacterized protein n=1 Tax=Apiospora marii TaxID=335849 RepID=UPI0031312786